MLTGTGTDELDLDEEVEYKRNILSGKWDIHEFEDRDDQLLRWNTKFTIPNSKNYDYQKELDKLIDTKANSKSNSFFSSFKPNNNKSKESDAFNWYNQSIISYTDQTSNKKFRPSRKTCHTATDIGDSIIMIGGMSQQTQKVEIMQFYKTFKRVHKFTNIHGNKGSIPCCRWAHSAEYIAPLNAIIMIGGFDSTYNWNDIRLLFFNESQDIAAWYNLSLESDMRCRALHSSCVRYITLIDKEKGLQRGLCQVYIFGGQYCRGGPYEYNNEVFCIQFYDKMKAYLPEKEKYIGKSEEIKVTKMTDKDYIDIKHAFVTGGIVETFGNDDDEYPQPRSQNFSFLDENMDKLWIYGGLNASTEFNDLWYLDLNNMKWNKYNYSLMNILNPPSIQSLHARNFRLNLYGDLFYYSPKQQKLLVLHCVAGQNTIDRMQAVMKRQDIIFARSLHMIHINDDNKELSKRELEIMDKEIIKYNGFVKNIIDNIYWIYVLNLKNGEWDLIKDGVNNRLEYQIVASRLHRIGDKLWLIGGQDSGNQIKVNRLNNIIGFNIPSICISWKQERLIWIGNLKNDNNNKCKLSNLPKAIVGFILSFFKQNVW